MRLVEFCATLVGVVALLLLPVAQAEEGVLDFESPEELDAAIQSNEFLVVKFVAPWCGHCQHLAPEYAKAAEILAAASSPIVLASADMTIEANKPLQARYEVRGFPTLKIFRDGNAQPIDYNGPRDAEGIVKYLKQISGPAFVEVTAADVEDQIASLSEESDTVFVLSPSKSGAAEEIDAFKKAAAAYRDNGKFVIVTDGQEGKIVAHSKLHPSNPTLASPFETSALTEFVLDAIYVPFGQLKPAQDAAMDAFLKTKRTRLLLFVDTRQDEQMSTVTSLSQSSIAPRFFIAYLDGPNFPQALGHFGVKEKDLPVALVMSADEKGERFRHNGKFDVEEIVSFAESARSGKIDPFFKSEEPVDNTGRAVHRIVRKNFDDAVLNAKAETLLKIYAPWCGHCKAMAPAYEALGEVVHGAVSDVHVAEFDGTENDMPPGLNVRGYPTVLWFPGNGEKPVTYDGARTARAMYNYIKAQSKHSLPAVDSVGLPDEAASDEHSTAGDSHPAATLDRILFLLNSEYAFGLKGWVYAGGAAALSVLATILFILSMRSSGSEEEEEVKTHKKTDGDKKKEESAASAETPKKKSSSSKKKSSKDE